MDQTEVAAAAEAQWNRDAAIRAEFRSKEGYVAYCKAVARGEVRITGRKVFVPVPSGE
jgi:hypothetical protein